MNATGSRENAELARAMGPVAREILGEPTEKHKGGREWRYGARGSLSIQVDTGQWFDHEAGIGGGVLDLLRARKGLLNGAALTWLEERGHLRPSAAPNPAQRRVVAEYSYTDADGTLLYQVVRYEPKDFRQRRPDGNGGWAWKMGGVQLVLYRLPDVLDAIRAGELVYVTEGEKAADALAGLGFTATCSPGGAGKWRDEYAPFLAGADVVVLPDNDDAGRRHAAAIAKSVSKVARQVRTVTLPRLPVKGDVADWIAAGGTALEFERLAEAAAPEPPPAERAGTLKLIDPRTLAGVPVPRREWIVQDWLPVGAVTADFGDGGTGKTLLAQQLQTACATGAPWCGLPVTPCRSLGLYCEDDPGELHRRQSQINQALGVDFGDLGEMQWLSGVGSDNALVSFVSEGRMIVSPRFNLLKEAAMDLKVRLLVLDTAADLFAGNENDRHQVRQFISLLSGLAVEINGAVLLNAHPSRTGLSTGNLDGGSTAWNNGVRSRWSLARPATDGEDVQPDTDERILTKRKANYSSIGDTIALVWRNGALWPRDLVGNASGGLAGAASRGRAREVFLRLLEEFERSGRRVSDSPNAGHGRYAPTAFAADPRREGCSMKDFKQAMAELYAEGVIESVPFGRKGDERRKIALASRVSEPGDTTFDDVLAAAE